MTKLWAQSLLVDASAAVGIDLTDIHTVELDLRRRQGAGLGGRPVRRPATLAPVPASRMPQLNIPEVKIPEGNPSGGKKQVTRTAQVPFTITGNLTKPAQFKVVTVGEQVGGVKTSIVNVAPGTTSGTFPVTYSADRLDDDDMPYSISAWGTKELATDDYLGRVTITDDDPDAKAKVTAPATVREGQPITVTVKLTNPSDVWFAQLEVTPTHGRRTLTGADVPLRWLKQFNPEPDLSLPLWQTGVFLYKDVKSGVMEVTFVIPTRRDGRHEGAETLNLRIRAKDAKKTVTVRVVDR